MAEPAMERPALSEENVHLKNENQMIAFKFANRLCNKSFIKDGPVHRINFITV